MDASSSGILVTITNVFLLLTNIASVYIWWCIFINSPSAMKFKVGMAVVALSVMFVIDIVYRIVLIKKSLDNERVVQHIMPLCSNGIIGVHIPRPTVKKTLISDDQSIPVLNNSYQVGHLRESCFAHPPADVLIIDELVNMAQSENIISPQLVHGKFPVTYTNVISIDGQVLQYTNGLVEQLLQVT